MRFAVLLLSMVFGVAIHSHAAPHRVIVKKPGKQGSYIQQGQFRGGDAGRNFIFHDLRRAFGKQTGIERYIFEFTDGNGESIKARPGYYQVTADPKGQRLFLEFSQVLGSRLNATQIQKAFQASPYVKSTKMTYDPEDSGLAVQLFLKSAIAKNLEIEVFEIASEGKGGRVALDLRVKKP